MTNTDPRRKAIENAVVEIVSPLTPYGLDVGRLDHKDEFPHIDKLVDYIAQEVEAAHNQHFENYAWLLGYNDDVPSEPGRRWAWRTELRKRLPKSIIDRLTTLTNHTNGGKPEDKDEDLGH